MATALITGATGFLGRHTVRALKERGHSVRAMARNPPRDIGALFGEGLAPIRLFGSVLVGISAYLIARLLPAVAGRDDATTRRLGGLAGLAVGARARLLVPHVRRAARDGLPERDGGRRRAGARGGLARACVGPRAAGRGNRPSLCARKQHRDQS